MSESDLDNYSKGEGVWNKIRVALMRRKVNMITWDLVKQLDWVKPHVHLYSESIYKIYYHETMEFGFNPQEPIIKKVRIR